MSVRTACACAIRRCRSAATKRARALVQRVLCHTRGLYSRWLQSQGGSAHVILQRERVFSVSTFSFSTTIHKE